jgi:hypothetical protein
MLVWVSKLSDLDFPTEETSSRIDLFGRKEQHVVHRLAAPSSPPERSYMLAITIGSAAAAHADDAWRGHRSRGVCLNVLRFIFMAGLRFPKSSKMHAILLRGDLKASQRKSFVAGRIGPDQRGFVLGVRRATRTTSCTCFMQKWLLFARCRPARKRARALVPGDRRSRPFFAGGRSKNLMFETRGRNVALCATAVRAGKSPVR